MAGKNEVLLGFASKTSGRLLVVPKKFPEAIALPLVDHCAKAIWHKPIAVPNSNNVFKFLEIFMVVKF